MPQGCFAKRTKRTATTRNGAAKLSFFGTKAMVSPPPPPGSMEDQPWHTWAPYVGGTQKLRGGGSEEIKKGGKIF